jgi:spore maturation protein CgeB
VLGTGVISSARIRRQVPYEEESQAYASAKISLNFHEQMEGGWFLLNGRTFKIPACGGFEICDYVPLARRFFSEDELVMAKDDDDFFKKVDYYMTHDRERKRIQEKGTARALKEHTYHNRAKLILDWYKEMTHDK